MRISGLARGLAGALGLNAYGGEGFREVENAIRVIIDAERFFGANNRITPYYPSANAVAGFNAIATVPAGQCWVIRAGGVALDAPAGGSCSYRVAVQTPGSSTSVQFSDLRNVAASTSSSNPISFPGVILEPGSIIGVLLLNVVGGPFPCNFTGIIDQFDAG